MKKNMMAIVGMLMFVGSNAVAMTAAQVKNRFDLAIDTTFGGRTDSSFYSTPFDSANINACYDAAAKVKAFVYDHSKNLFGSRDSLLNEAAAELERVTMDVINAIKITKGATTAPGIKASIGSLDSLESKINGANSLANKVAKESFTISEKKESKSVLGAAYGKLLDLIRKAVRAAVKK